MGSDSKFDLEFPQVSSAGFKGELTSLKNRLQELQMEELMESKGAIRLVTFFGDEAPVEEQCEDFSEFKKRLQYCKSEEDLEELVNKYFFGEWRIKYQDEDAPNCIFEQVIDEHGKSLVDVNSGYFLKIMLREE